MTPNHWIIPLVICFIAAGLFLYVMMSVTWRDGGVQSSLEKHDVMSSQPRRPQGTLIQKKPSVSDATAKMSDIPQNKTISSSAKQQNSGPDAISGSVTIAGIIAPPARGMGDHRSLLNQDDVSSQTTRSLSATTKEQPSIPLATARISDTASINSISNVAKQQDSASDAISGSVTIAGVPVGHQSSEVLSTDGPQFSGNLARYPSTAALKEEINVSEAPAVETAEQYQTQFGDAAFNKAVTERLIDESNSGKP